MSVIYRNNHYTFRNINAEFFSQKKTQWMTYALNRLLSRVRKCPILVNTNEDVGKGVLVCAALGRYIDTLTSQCMPASMCCICATDIQLTHMEFQIYSHNVWSLTTIVISIHIYIYIYIYIAFSLSLSIFIYIYIYI